MCVQGFIQDFEFWDGAKFNVDVVGVYLRIYIYIYFFLIGAQRLILRHSGGTSSQ